jgi:hypothetical protein
MIAIAFSIRFDFLYPRSGLLKPDSAKSGFRLLVYDCSARASIDSNPA